MYKKQDYFQDISETRSMMDDQQNFYHSRDGRVLALFSLPVWLFRYWRGKISGRANIHIQLWILLPVGLLISTLIFISGGTIDGIKPLAHPFIFSVGIMLSTIAFFVSAVLSLVMIIKYQKRKVKKSIYIPAAILSGLHTLVVIYLLWYGVIGLQTWAKKNQYITPSWHTLKCQESKYHEKRNTI